MYYSYELEDTQQYIFDSIKESYPKVDTYTDYKNAEM